MSAEDPKSKPRRDKPPHPDHSLDQASPQVHQDPRAGDVGATGAVDRGAGQSGHIDHGIDQVLKESVTPRKDHGADMAHESAHKDESADDTGSGGATHRG